MLPAVPMLRQHCRPTTPVCPDDHASAYAAEPDASRNEMARLASLRRWRMAGRRWGRSARYRFAASGWRNHRL